MLIGRVCKLPLEIPLFVGDLLIIVIIKVHCEDSVAMQASPSFSVAGAKADDDINPSPF